MLNPIHASNNVEATGNEVVSCCDIVAGWCGPGSSFEDA